MDNNAAHNAISASSVWFPKSTILLIVDATELLICVITKTPRKLNTALIMIAARTGIHLVATQVAIAFGASVQPFTKITPRVSRTVINSIGLLIISCQKFTNVNSILFSSGP